MHHGLLIEKLVGLEISLLRWLASYSLDRELIVTCDGALSVPFRALSGVPPIKIALQRLPIALHCIYL